MMQYKFLYLLTPQKIPPHLKGTKIAQRTSFLTKTAIYCCTLALLFAL